MYTQVPRYLGTNISPDDDFPNFPRRGGETGEAQEALKLAELARVKGSQKRGLKVKKLVKRKRLVDVFIFGMFIPIWI